MAEPTRITRTIETDLPPDELWRLVVDGDEWASWMVDAADVRIEPGGGGTVVDDGVERAVRVDRLDDDDDHHRVGFTWWPDDRPDLASAVELIVLPAATGSRLLVTETQASTTAATRAWDVRLLLLAARALLVSA